MGTSDRDSLLLGIDVGSSDCKALLMTTTGRVVATAVQPYATTYPRPGWSEQDPEDWYAAACQSVDACLRAARVSADRVIAIAVDGPAHNVALVDIHDRIIRPTLHWSDLRSAPQSDALEAEMGDRVFELTYSIVNPSWTLSQLQWLRENEPDHWKRLHRIYVTKDYVRHRLTGDYATDRYDAIGTQLYEIREDRWSRELCDVLERDTGWLPAVYQATDIAGQLTAQAASDTGLKEGTPVVIGSGDSVVEAFGIGAVEAGAGVVKLGTAANVNLVSNQALPSRKSITYRHLVPGHWFSITATNAGASTMRWFRDTFCRLEVQQAQAQGISVYKLIDQLAEGAPPGADGLLFHPYLMGERTPYWNPHLRGSFNGISTRHNAHHFARAILEGVAYSIRECMAVVAELGQPLTHPHLIGGGAKSRLWRQILCDVLGVPLAKPSVEDAAFGSALLAGVGIGLYRDVREAVSQCVSVEEHLIPNMEQHALYSEYFAVYRDIVRDQAVHDLRLSELAERYSVSEDSDP